MSRINGQKEASLSDGDRSSNSLIGFLFDLESSARDSVQSPNERSDGRSLETNPLENVIRTLGHKLRLWRMAQKHRSKSIKVHMQEQLRREAEFARSWEGIELRKKWYDRYGPIGVALFSPIQGAFSRDFDESNNEDRITENKFQETSPRCTDNETSEEEDTDWEECTDEGDLDVHIIPDDESVPRLLSQHATKELMKFVPLNLHGRSLLRLYSITRDGDSFAAFLGRVKGHKNTLIVVQTTRGDILGGFADASWHQACKTKNGCFFGTGTSFLFSINPRECEDSVRVFLWRGINEYSQLCRWTDGAIGMGGGGGSFGIFLQDDFTRGTSGPCETYGNIQPLSNSECFDVLNFEVYGFDRIF
jgi:hypothetical protein